MTHIPPDEYFRKDLQECLPAVEVHRRQLIEERLEEQYTRWRQQEQQKWCAITQPHTVSFLGIDWTSVPPSIKQYVSVHRTSFALLSELQLSTIEPAFAKYYEGRSDHRWLYEQYRRYAIRVQDLGSPAKQYEIPLIDATVVVGQDPVLFENASPDAVSKMLPARNSTFRLVRFPQTRYSFIEDEVFRTLYPLPEEQVRILSHKLLHRFRGLPGHYNASAVPFTESFSQESYKGREFVYYAALYPVIKRESTADYEGRKRSEELASLLQRQDREAYPSISQWKYSRRFDLTGESNDHTASPRDPDHPEGIHSARGLFEYSCGELNTLSLDLRQASLLEEENSDRRGRYLLVVDPFWLLVFPESNTICAFRDERKVSDTEAPFDGVENEGLGAETWCQVLLQLVNTADEYMGSYEPTYRTRLAKLQFRIHEYDQRDHALVKSLSDFVAELTILLDPLQAQIDIIIKWQNWFCKLDKPSTSSLFEDAAKTRRDHFNSLKQLRERARESQAVLFQLSNTETAYQQSQLAKKMAVETTLQVELARKAERQNRAILMFTIITVIFLPLSFFTSYFGMNTKDIRDTAGTQGLFWAVAAPLSSAVVAVAMIFAFRPGLGRFFLSSGINQVC